MGAEQIVGEIFAALFGLVLCVGAGLSLVPLIVNMIRNRSARGISFFTISIACFSCFTGVVNALIENWATLTHCTRWIECLNLIEVDLQFLVMWVMYSLVITVFLIFYHNKHLFYDWLIVRIIAAIYFVFMSINVLICVALLIVFGSEASIPQTYAKVMGIVASVLVFIQWSPQIYRTWKTHGAGNFSIITVCILAPGSWIVTFYLAVLMRQNISTWLQYAVAGVQQIVLFSLLVYFEFIQKRVLKSSASSDRPPQRHFVNLVGHEEELFAKTHGSHRIPRPFANYGAIPTEDADPNSNNTANDTQTQISMIYTDGDEKRERQHQQQQQSDNGDERASFLEHNDVEEG